MSRPFIPAKSPRSALRALLSISISRASCSCRRTGMGGHHPWLACWNRNATTSVGVRTTPYRRSRRALPPLQSAPGHWLRAGAQCPLVKLLQPASPAAYARLIKQDGQTPSAHSRRGACLHALALSAASMGAQRRPAPGPHSAQSIAGAAS